MTVFMYVDRPGLPIGRLFTPPEYFALDKAMMFSWEYNEGGFPLPSFMVRDRKGVMTQDRNRVGPDAPKWVVGKHQLHRECRVAMSYGKCILIWDKCNVFARYPWAACSIITVKETLTIISASWPRCGFIRQTSHVLLTYDTPHFFK